MFLWKDFFIRRVNLSRCLVGAAFETYESVKKEIFFQAPNVVVLYTSTNPQSTNKPKENWRNNKGRKKHNLITKRIFYDSLPGYTTVT